METIDAFSFLFGLSVGAIITGILENYFFKK